MLSEKKKAKKLLAENKNRKGEQVRLKGLVSDLSKVRVNLEGKIQHQSDELKKKNGQLKNGAAKQIQSEEHIHICTKAMDAATDGIFIIDALKPDFPVIYANRAFQQMTGYSKKEIIGRNYFLFYGIDANPDTVNKIKNAIHEGKTFHEEMLRKGKPFQEQVINIKKNGSKCWNLLRIAPLRDAHGNITHYVGIKTDVTLMMEKELKIDEQREELLHVTRVGMLAEFVSSLAHEISQPLTAILSYSQAAQRMLAGREPELREILSYIIEDDQRAAEVIQRLRMLLKKRAPDMKRLDINAIITDTIEVIGTDAIVRNSIIKTEFDANLSFVRGDRIQLQQVLLNLISNSFDAMENSKGAHKILIHTARKDAGTIKVSIKDSGCGIPQRNMPKIFTRFFTSKPDGLGMGLSISRSIIESHGGRLDIEKNPNRGTTFYFTLPVIKKDS